MTVIKILSLGLAIVFAASCIHLMGGDVAILEKSAKLLREQSLNAEAATIEDAAKRIKESRLRREASVDLGIDVYQTLRNDADKLREMKRGAAAKQLESFAEDYRAEQVGAFLRQSGGR
jgi:sensor domain CHASE-containing protein